jgi:hypothetical protein
MTGTRGARARRIAILILAAAVSPLAGCSSGQANDFERANTGSLKTPSDIKREADAQYGNAKRPAAAGKSKNAPK